MHAKVRQLIWEMRGIASASVVAAIQFSATLWTALCTMVLAVIDMIWSTSSRTWMTFLSVHLGLSWVEIESTAVKVDRCFEVLTVSVAADTSLDRHDLAVEAFSNGIGDPMCAVADDVG